MNESEILKCFFANMKCSNCYSHFEEDSITILRSEDNYTVVRLFCSECQKNIGMAILGINEDDAQKSINTTQEKEYFETQEEKPPITCDDVLEAHKFISELDADWQKYLPSE